MPRAVVLLLLILASPARADGPWPIALAAGPAIHRIDLSQLPELDIGVSTRLDAGYRVLHTEAVGAALGVHVGIGVVRAGETSSQTYFPIEAGIGAQLVLVDRLLIAPWAGFVDIDDRRINAAGVELGYDFRALADERLSAVASFTRAPGRSGYSYNGVGLGIAYRYW